MAVCLILAPLLVNVTVHPASQILPTDQSGRDTSQTWNLDLMAWPSVVVRFKVIAPLFSMESPLAAEKLAEVLPLASTSYPGAS